MEIAELPIEILKQRARSGDHRALQALRDSGFFRSRGAAAEGEPVSPAQQRLWVAARQSPDGDAFVIVRALRLRGPLRRPELRQALAVLQTRHAMLRSRFSGRNGVPRRFVEAPGDLPLEEVDLRRAADPEGDCRNHLREAARRAFDLERGPVWRVHLCRLGDEDHVLGVVIHHIVADAWSLEVISRELALLYRARCEGRDDRLPPLPDVDPADVRETEERLAEAGRYWRGEGAPPPPPPPPAR